MSNINLDQAKAKRAAEKTTVTFKGQNFPLVKELPFKVFKQLEAMQDEQDLGVLEFLLSAIFGSDALRDQFLALDPSLEDINTLFESVSSVYGVEVKARAAKPDDAPA